MLDYTGVKCPVCGVPFGADDDIVVCPECGAPYHRECYRQKGKCVFGDLHEQGKEWAPPAPPKAPDPAVEIKDQECPVCGTLNGHSALFCSRCGTSLLGQPQTYNNTYAGPQRDSNPGQQNVPPYVPPFTGQPRPGYGGTVPPFVGDPMGGVSPADMLDEGVTFGDASKLVKQNTNYYMPVFRYMKMSGRNKFNYCAFFFTGGWMLYRKQYKLGAVVTALVFCLYLAYILVSLFVSAPVLAELAKQAGLDLTQGINPTSPEWLALTELLMADPVSYLKLALPTLSLVVLLIVRIIIGIRGNKMYMEHCVRTVRMVKAEGNDADPNMTLDAKGGVNSALGVCLGLCYFMILLPMLI